MEECILVDTNDHALGTMEKIEAHQRGILHRAFSLLVYNSKGEVLLQKRARGKYHSGGLWTNACCSHPAPGDEMEAAIQRRLAYEMGLEVLPLFAFSFIYRAEVGNGLIEHEYDHVYMGTTDATPVINMQEVEQWKLMDMPALFEDVARHPAQYTPWFRLIMAHPEFLAVRPNG